MNYIEDNCCFCVKEVESSVKINDLDDDYFTYINKLKFVFPDLKLPEEKCLPISICFLCCENLRQAYDFKQQCVKSFTYWGELGYPEIKPAFFPLKPELILLPSIEEENTSSDSKFNNNETVSNFEYEQESNELDKYKERNNELKSENEFFIKDEIISDDSSDNYNEDQNENASNNSENEMEIKSEITSDGDNQIQTNNSDGQPLLQVADQVAISNRIELTCGVCKNIFPNKIRLANHMKFHSDNRPYDCERCGKSFMTLRDYNTHLLVHIEEKNYECSICQNKFKTTANLNVHMKLHSETYVKPSFNCDLCGKTFQSTSAYYYHKKLHNTPTEKRYIKTFSYDVTELPYPCTVCKKSFIEKKRLEKHMRFHMDDRPYVCELCGKTFVQSCGLKNHLLTHSDEKKYKCKYCQKRFKNPGSLTIHVDTHLDREHLCTVCNKTFKNLSTYYSHRKTHRMQQLAVEKPPEEEKATFGPKLPFECDVCPKSFMDRTKLTKHKRTHSNDRPHKCEICGKNFMQLCGLKQHLLVHTNGKNFECNTCKKLFKTDITLRIHKEKRKCPMQSA